MELETPTRNYYLAAKDFYELCGWRNVFAYARVKDKAPQVISDYGVLAKQGWLNRMTRSGRYVRRFFRVSVEHGMVHLAYYFDHQQKVARFERRFPADKLSADNPDGPDGCGYKTREFVLAITTTAMRMQMAQAPSWPAISLYLYGSNGFSQSVCACVPCTSKVH